MNKMQAFHAWLFAASSDAPRDPDAARLSRLTEVTPAQMGALKADLDWETWSSVEPAANGVPQPVS